MEDIKVHDLGDAIEIGRTINNRMSIKKHEIPKLIEELMKFVNIVSKRY